MKKRVGLVTNEASLVGGLATMLRFLYCTLEQSGRYEPEVISLGTSASDRASLQLRAPSTWNNAPRIENLPWHDLMFRHAGVWASEIEFQRYKPRRNLTELLQGYDLIQFVVGCPPWVCVAENISRPILLWTATTTRPDRESQMRTGSLARRVWSNLMVPITEHYERRALKMADSVLALSEYTRAAVEPIVGDKVLLASCGVDTDLFRPSRGPKGDYILCVARFWDPRKNVQLLLEAYALLKQRLPRIPDLYLIGDPPSAQSQQDLQSLGLGENVRMLGPRQGDELAQLYRDAQFFVLSSNEEGLGIVILEAMASGLPVVTTACGGPASVVKEGETGFLTPTGDVAALADAIEKLLTQPELRARMGAAGRKRVETQFSFAAAGKVFLDKYDELLRNSSRSNIQGPPTGDDRLSNGEGYAA